MPMFDNDPNKMGMPLAMGKQNCIKLRGGIQKRKGRKPEG